MSRCLAIALAALLSSCGFHMQGTLTTPEEMQRTYIATEDRHSLFYRELRLQLQASGVDVVDSPAESTATFSITFDETDQRVLSVSARNVPTEYEVYYTIQYRVDSGTERLLEAQDVTVTRDYTYDELLVLGKAREEALLRDACVDDLVRIVLRQVSTL